MSDAREPRKGYMDLTDFDCELGLAPDVKVFRSIRDLCHMQGCADSECGIAEVEVRVVRIVKGRQDCVTPTQGGDEPHDR